MFLVKYTEPGWWLVGNSSIIIAVRDEEVPEVVGELLPLCSRSVRDKLRKAAKTLTEFVSPDLSGEAQRAATILDDPPDEGNTDTRMGPVFYDARDQRVVIDRTAFVVEAINALARTPVAYAFTQNHRLIAFRNEYPRRRYAVLGGSPARAMGYHPCAGVQQENGTVFAVTTEHPKAALQAYANEHPGAGGCAIHPATVHILLPETRLPSTRVGMESKTNGEEEEAPSDG